ncbi:hypothetical protein ABK040_002497 [Willaertia magna]
MKKSQMPRRDYKIHVNNLYRPIPTKQQQVNQRLKHKTTKRKSIPQSSIYSQPKTTPLPYRRVLNKPINILPIKLLSSFLLDKYHQHNLIKSNKLSSPLIITQHNQHDTNPLPDILVNTVKNITYKKIPSSLSSGGNGIVALYQTIDLDNPCKVVIKRIDNDIASSETDIDLINNKFSKLHSKHIIQCKDYFETDGYFYFVMDYCGYNLREYILHKGTKIITPFFILQLIIQITTALNYLNEQQLFHGDLKLENIFVSEELNEILKSKNGYLYII